jgi:hypothetical protein
LFPAFGSGLNDLISAVAVMSYVGSNTVTGA